MTVQIRLIILTEKFKDTKMTLEFANAKMQENLEKLLKNNETYKKLDSAKEAVSHHKSFAKHLLNKGWKKLVSHKVAGHEGEIFVHPDSRHVITLIRHKNASKGHVERNQKHVYMSRQFAINHVSEAAGHIGIRPAYYNTHYATFKTTDDGRIIMAGGMTPDPEDSDQPKTVTQVTVLNPENSQQPWSELPSMPVGLFGPGCAFVNGVFLVFGGAALAEQGMNYQTAIYAFDLKNFAAGWNKLGDLGEAKGFVQAVVTENKVFVLGGTKTEEKSPVAGPNDAIEIIEVTRLN
jgi:hypothetical protein